MKDGYVFDVRFFPIVQIRSSSAATHVNILVGVFATKSKELTNMLLRVCASPVDHSTHLTYYVQQSAIWWGN